MSDDEKVGRRRPPTDTQFKPGQSGNPRGRPRKAPRAEIPSQIGRDVRAVARRKITANTPDGPLRVTLLEAALIRVAIDAIGGKISQQRFFINLVRDAFDDNVIRNAVLRRFDVFVSAFQDPEILDDAVADLVVSLAERSKRS